MHKTERQSNPFVQRFHFRSVIGKIVSALLVFSLGTSVWANSRFDADIAVDSDFDTLGNNPPGVKFPSMPEDDMTPGSLCASPDEFRYPEKIKYCERSVSTTEKRQIIQIYDQTYGFQVGQMDRADFKIDHLIPLCAGGSNERTNLWPQHKTVYTKTDKIEETLCRLMSMGRLKQAQAVKIILDVKHNLHTAEAVLKDLENRAKGGKGGDQDQGQDRDQDQGKNQDRDQRDQNNGDQDQDNGNQDQGARNAKDLN